MSTQPPARFENYPPGEEQAPGAGFGMPGPQSDQALPSLPAQVVPPTGRTTRRTMIGLAAAIPAVLVGVVVIGSVTMRTEDGAWVEVGDYSADVPEGWTVISDVDVVRVENGANRLSAAALETAASAVAVEEISARAAALSEDFAGAPGEPVDRSTAELQHATLDSVGTYRDRAARLLSELWIDEDGSGLLVVRILTAKPQARISLESQDMLNELSSDF